MSIVTTLKQNVARGAALLDEKVPDWYLRIEPARVDIDDETKCVLGLLYGTYCEGTLALDIELKASAYGFTTVPTPGWVYNWPFQFDVLNDLWRTTIAARRCTWLVIQHEEEVLAA